LIRLPVTDVPRGNSGRGRPARLLQPNAQDAHLLLQALPDLPGDPPAFRRVVADQDDANRRWRDVTLADHTGDVFAIVALYFPVYLVIVKLKAINDVSEPHKAVHLGPVFVIETNEDPA